MYKTVKYFSPFERDTFEGLNLFSIKKVRNGNGGATLVAEAGAVTALYCLRQHFTENPQANMKRLLAGDDLQEFINELKEIMKNPKPITTEISLHIQVVRYIKLQYKGVIFDSNAIQHTKSYKMQKTHGSLGIPDILILEPCNGYHGLCLELKNGERGVKQGVHTGHFKTQIEMCKGLNERGFVAHIVCNFDDAKYIIDCYLNSQQINVIIDEHRVSRQAIRSS